MNYNLYPDDNGAGRRDRRARPRWPRRATRTASRSTYLYPNDSTNTRVFEAIQASLALCGITLNGKGEPGSSFFTDLGNAPENNKAGTWDMGQAGWIPDWFGNNGRTVIQALFQGPNCVVNTVNYGCYNNPAVNTLITQAEAATTLTAAGDGLAPGGRGHHEGRGDRAHHEPDVPDDRQHAGPVGCCRTAPPTRRPCSRRTSATRTSPTSGSRAADAR